MAQGITNRQALVLVSNAVGWQVDSDRLLRVLRELSKDERLSAEHEHDGLLYPEDVDLIAGQVWRMRAGWYQRRNVNGDLDAWLKLGDDRWMLLRLPFERVWNQQTRAEDLSVPEKVEMWTWPTGEYAGVVVRAGERHGLPAYEVVPDKVSREKGP